MRKKIRTVSVSDSRMSEKKYRIIGGISIIAGSFIMFIFGISCVVAGLFSIPTAAPIVVIGIFETSVFAFGLAGGIFMLKKKAFALVVIGDILILVGGILAILPIPGTFTSASWPVGLTISLLSFIGMVSIFQARRNFKIDKKNIASIIVFFIFSVAATAVWFSRVPRQISGWEVIVEPSSNPEHFNAGVASISFPYQENEAAESKLNRILNGWGDTGQYRAVSSSTGGPNYRYENGRYIYSYELRLLGSGESSVPSVHQGGDNFCFYAHAINIVGSGYTLWDQIGYGSVMIILPENHELVNDVSVSHGPGHKDNEFSIFTSASTSSKGFENGRWTIKADWEEGKFDKYNTDFYIEIYYQKTV